MKQNLTNISSNQDNMQPVKKSRRNLAALETGDEKRNPQEISSVSTENVKKFSQKRNLNIFDEPSEYINTNINESTVRKSSRLSENISKDLPSKGEMTTDLPKVSRRAPRNLDKLEEDVVFSIKEKETKMALRNEKIFNDKGAPRGQNNTRGGYNRYDTRYDRVYNKPIEEKKEEANINVLDTELFPTLQGAENNNPIKTSKLSVWNMTNHNITTVKPKLEPVPQVIDKNKLATPLKNTDFKLNNNNASYDDDDSYDSDEYMEEIKENKYDNDIYNDEDDDDLEYISDLMEKEIELTNNIEFVERTHDPRNNFHLKFLHQLERELVTVEDDIYRHKCLENELEKIYGPKHIPYKSLYDEEVERREEEEKRIKSDKSVNPFLLQLNKLK